MAISSALNSAMANSGKATVTSTTLTNFTVTTGTDRCLFVFLSFDNSKSAASTASVVFNTSEGFTQLGSGIQNSSAKARAEIWYLAAPTVTTGSIVVTWTSNVKGTCVAAHQRNGVDQTTPMNGGVGSTSATTTITTNVTSSIGDVVVDTLAVYKDTAPATPGAGQTLIHNQASSTRMYQSCSNESGAATTTMSWSNFYSPKGATAQWCGNIVARPTSINYNKALPDTITISDVLSVRYLITGVTYNNVGTILGSCQVFLFKDNQDGTISFVNQAVSNVSTGVYSFEVANGNQEYIVMAWKDSIPHVFDVTDHVIVGKLG